MAAAVAKAVDALLAASTADARKAAATDVTLGSLAAGISSLAATVAKLKVAAVDKKSAGVREGAAVGFGALAAAFGQAGAPYLLPHLSVVTTLAADAASVKAAAEAAATALMATLNPNGVRFVAPLLFEATAIKYKWQSRVLALSLVGSLAKLAPGQTTRALPDLIPRLSEFMGDARAEVSKAAEDALLSVCSGEGGGRLAALLEGAPAAVRARPVSGRPATGTTRPPRRRRCLAWWSRAVVVSSGGRAGATHTHSCPTRRRLPAEAGIASREEPPRAAA